jgi:hypothetical protein
MQFIKLKLNNNTKLQLQQFSLFWILISFYFIIPFVSNTKAPPQLFLDIDSKIPFVWWLILPYYFHYIAIIIPPFLKWERDQFKHLTQILYISTIFCYIVFVLWPIGSGNLESTITPNLFDGLFRTIDLHWHKQNYFPSLHVVASGIIGLCIGSKFPKWKVWMWGYVFIIFLSTFLTKQHFIADSISGLIIAILGWKYWLVKVKITSKI